MPGEDEFRESQEQGGGESGAPSGGSLPPDDLPVWKKTATRLNSKFDEKTRSEIISQAEASNSRRKADNFWYIEPIGIDAETKSELTAQAEKSKRRGDFTNGNPPVFKRIELEPEIYDPSISRKNFDIENLKRSGKTTTERILSRKQYYNNFEDFAGKQFIHLLDYFSAQNRDLGGIGVPKRNYDGTFENGRVSYPDNNNIYLGSFIKTFDDNEDPTMLGYDIFIKWDDSPLFNGSIDAFIQQFGNLGNTEIKSRLDTLNRFKEQLLKFLKTNAPETSQSPKFEEGISRKDVFPYGAKTYYLKKISGLNRLIDATDSNEVKQFVDYGKDFITLSFNEDVSQNIGYLATLYKTLSYSRLNGRQIIPDNLLRFDVDIVITEIRKYNRVFKNITTGELDFVADKIARYTYTLNECQFFFTELPHGDTLDMSNPVLIDEYSIKFNYKFSFLKFTRFQFDVNSPIITVEDPIDNSKIIPTEIRSKDTNNSAISGEGDSLGSIVSAPKTETPKSTGKIDSDGSKLEPPTAREGNLEESKKADTSSKVKEETPNSLIIDTTLAQIEPIVGNLGNVKDLISKSSLKKVIDNNQIQLPSNIKGLISSGTLKNVLDLDKLPIGDLKSKLNGRFNEVSSILSNATSKGFNLGMLGGKLSSSLGSINKSGGSTQQLIKNNFEKIKQSIVDTGINSINNSLVSQASLLNKTLSNIRDVKIPGSSGIQKQLEKKATEQVQNFVGRSVKNFFSRR